MSEEAKLREDMCLIAKSIFDRGLTHGSSGNLSARLCNGTFLMTPTDSSFGFLDPSELSLLDKDFTPISGKNPTKELPLHSAFYETRPRTGAVVHLHSPQSVLLSIRSDLDPDDVLPAINPYSIMKLGKVKLLPFYMPGQKSMGNAVRKLNGQFSAIILANHGPVVAGEDLWSATYKIEELEANARLANEMIKHKVSFLSKEAIKKTWDIYKSKN